MLNFGKTLDWTINTYPTQIITPNGNITNKSHLALLRDDLKHPHNILGYVSPDYEVVQNQKLFDLSQPLIDNSIGYISNQGYLQYGKKVFLQIHLYEKFRLLDHEHSNFLTVLNSHNGSSSLKIGVGNIRIICENTFTQAAKALDSSYRHNVGINDQLDLQAVLQYVADTNNDYSTQVISLQKLSLKSSQCEKIIKHVFGDSDKVYNNIVNLYRNGKGNAGKTAYDLLSATTDYVSHYQKKNEISSMINPLIGSGANQSQKMMDVLLQLV
jgi:Domain of unknown function (DUF932)